MEQMVLANQKYNNEADPIKRAQFFGESTAWTAAFFRLQALEITKELE